MTREEFSEMLVEVRHNIGVSIRDMVFSLKILPPHLWRIEKAKHNYSISKAIEYLAALGFCIRVFNDYSDKIIRSQEDAIEWFKLLKNDVPVKLLAPKLGVSQTILHKILKGEGAFTIDMLLRIANFYNCNITIEKYE